MILGGPFFGDKKEDKIAIPIIGLISSLTWKVLFNWGVIKGHMNVYNRFAHSGDPIENNNGIRIKEYFEDRRSYQDSIKTIYLEQSRLINFITLKGPQIPIFRKLQRMEG